MNPKPNSRDRRPNQDQERDGLRALDTVRHYINATGRLGIPPKAETLEALATLTRLVSGRQDGSDGDAPLALQRLERNHIRNCNGWAPEQAVADLATVWRIVSGSRVEAGVEALDKERDALRSEVKGVRKWAGIEADNVDALNVELARVRKRVAAMTVTCALLTRCIPLAKSHDETLYQDIVRALKDGEKNG